MVPLVENKGLFHKIPIILDILSYLYVVYHLLYVREKEDWKTTMKVKTRK